MVDIKLKRSLKTINGVVYISIPKDIVDKYELQKGQVFEIDVMEEPELVILLRKLGAEIENEDKEDGENEKSQ